jgi:serine/threonine-protein kinase PknK
LHEKDDRIALVIDDWHRVSDPGTAAALGFLLEHGCHHMQIIVTSWSRARLPVSRLRIQDELIEIDCESMRFNDSEARSFLNDVGGLQLSGSDVDALTASTDGWAAALQLAALSLRGGGDANSLIGRLSGASDVVGCCDEGEACRAPSSRHAVLLSKEMIVRSGNDGTHAQIKSRPRGPGASVR